MPWLTPATLKSEADTLLTIMEAISPGPIAAAEQLVQLVLDNPTAESLICQVVNSISGATPPPAPPV